MVQEFFPEKVWDFDVISVTVLDVIAGFDTVADFDVITGFDVTLFDTIDVI